ncbi:MAG: HlyD family type I secretion periplasmic adaptor subunit [Pseudomonadota bacterium]
MSGQHGRASEAVVRTSPRLTIVCGLALFVVLFVGGGSWAYLANLAGAVIAQGSVVVAGKPKSVQHLDGGIVSEIRVREGQAVGKGELLIRLDDTLLRANLNIYRNRLREGIARKARLVAERDGAENVTWDTSLLELLGVDQDAAVRRGQLRLFEARKATRLGQISQLREKIAQFQSQTRGITALQSSKTAQLTMLDSELEGIRSLKKEGLAANSQLMGLERQREQLVGQNAEHDAELARIQNSISETKIQTLQIDREFRQSVLTELRQVEQEVNDMTQQFHATSEQLKRVEIRAPVAGAVHELGIFTIGGVIGAGAPVMQIVPQNEKLEIEANIAPQFVDELYVSQPTTLRFSAFNQRTTPELAGAIDGISANVVVNEQTGESFYKVRISVSAVELERLGGQALVPGMPVEAFIKTRERTAFNYLIKPLSDQLHRAFREE